MKECTQDDVGGHVIFTDPTGREHDALITAVHGTRCVNVVYVLKDKTQFDNYGRKTNKQYTSVMHGNDQQAHGNFWMWPGEERTLAGVHESVREGVQQNLYKPNPMTE